MLPLGISILSLNRADRIRPTFWLGHPSYSPHILNLFPLTDPVVFWGCEAFDIRRDISGGSLITFKQLGKCHDG